jgi:cell division protein FtsL
MNAISNKWKPELLSSASAGDDSMYSSSTYQDVEQDELNIHIADKKTKQVSRMVEAMVILFVVAIAAFAVYKVFTSC